MIIVIVAVTLVGAAVFRVVRELVVVHQYGVVCVDVRTNLRTPMDRCALVGQDAYRRWYIEAGDRVPRIGDTPHDGSTKRPEGTRVRITEGLADRGGVFLR